MFKFTMEEGWFVLCVYPCVSVSFSLVMGDCKTPHCLIDVDLPNNYQSMCSYIKGASWGPVGFQRPLGEVRCQHCGWWTCMVKDDCENCAGDLYDFPDEKPRVNEPTSAWYWKPFFGPREMKVIKIKDTIYEIYESWRCEDSRYSWLVPLYDQDNCFKTEKACSKYRGVQYREPK